MGPYKHAQPLCSCPQWHGFKFFLFLRLSFLRSICRYGRRCFPFFLFGRALFIRFDAYRDLRLLFNLRFDR